MTAITIGWTKFKTGDSYVPFVDGYRSGAAQHSITVESETGSLTTEDIANAVYEATNAPTVHPDTLAGDILAQIHATGYRGQDAHFSLSVGDTVTAKGWRAACARSGWTVTKLDDAPLDQDAELRARYRVSLEKMEFKALLDALQASTRQAATWGTFTDEAANGREAAEMARAELTSRFEALSFQAATLRQVAELTAGVLEGGEAN
jgi:hypothetical protein